MSAKLERRGPESAVKDEKMVTKVLLHLEQRTLSSTLIGLVHASQENKQYLIDWTMLNQRLCGVLGNLQAPIYANSSSRNTSVWATCLYVRQKGYMESPKPGSLHYYFTIGKGGWGNRGVFKRRE